MLIVRFMHRVLSSVMRDPMDVMEVEYNLVVTWKLGA